jgi:hypothetical protein
MYHIKTKFGIVIVRIFLLLYWWNNGTHDYKRPLTQRQIQYLLCPPLICKTFCTRFEIDSINRWILACGILCHFSTHYLYILIWLYYQYKIYQWTTCKIRTLLWFHCRQNAKFKSNRTPSGKLKRHMPQRQP